MSIPEGPLRQLAALESFLGSCVTVHAEARVEATHSSKINSPFEGWVGMPGAGWNVANYVLCPILVLSFSSLFFRFYLCWFVCLFARFPVDLLLRTEYSQNVLCVNTKKIDIAGKLLVVVSYLAQPYD